MKTKTLRKNKVNVITLGCSKNLFDSEVLMGQLKANQVPVQHEGALSDANIAVINTCGFIENAKKESIDTILSCVAAKQRGELEKVYVTGCLSERYRDELSAEIPEVDAYFGTRELPRLLKTLKADYKQELVGERLLTTPQHYAYLKISEGCDRPCSFCAIPLMRGKHRSVPIEVLVNQASQLARQGVKELILIAQDSTYYGLDLYGKRKLASLMEQLANVDGVEWIRLHYAFPAGFPEDVIETIAKYPQICNYLDIPLQHASDSILKSMRRGTTMEKTNRLLEKLRKGIPDIAIRTTLIVGYPGETEQDFTLMKDWVAATRFDRLGVFTYSHEENTHAFSLEDDVLEEEKQSRAEQIMELQQSISLDNNKKLVGTNLKVLFDRKEGPFWVGRTEWDSPEVDNEVLVRNPPKSLKTGAFANVHILEADAFDLTGEIRVS